MNYIDLFFIAFIALCVIFSLFGKWWNKLAAFIGAALAIPLSFIFANTFCDKVLALPASKIKLLSNPGTMTIGEWLVTKLKSIEIVDKLYNMLPSFRNLIDVTPEKLSKFILLFIIGLVLLIVLPPICGLVMKIFTRRRKKHTAFLTFGLFGLLRGIAASIVLIIPLASLAPILTDAGEIYSSFDSENTAIVEKINKVDEVFSDSWFVNKGVDYFSEHKIQFLMYEGSDGTERYYFDDISDVASLVTMYSKISNFDATNINPSDAAEMIKEIGNSDFTKQMISDVLGELGIEGIDVSKIDFNIEAETITEIMDIVSNGTGEDLDTLDLSDNLSMSVLALAVAKNNEGILADELTEEQVNSIKNELQAKVVDPESEFTQEEYDILIGLFEQAE